MNSCLHTASLHEWGVTVYKFNVEKNPKKHGWGVTYICKKKNNKKTAKCLAAKVIRCTLS